MRNRAQRQLFVSSLSGAATRGMLRMGGISLPCALGRAGRRALKREGDGATPIGSFALERVLYRPDRVQRPVTGLPVEAIGPNDGWCDSVQDRNYNRAICHPYPASAEFLWRNDALYDIIVVLAYNRRPCVRGRGSAIFMHVARPGYEPTEGCIALKLSDLQMVLKRLGRHARVRVP